MVEFPPGGYGRLEGSLNCQYTCDSPVVHETETWTVSDSFPEVGDPIAAQGAANAEGMFIEMTGSVINIENIMNIVLGRVITSPSHGLGAVMQLLRHVTVMVGTAGL